MASLTSSLPPATTEIRQWVLGTATELRVLRSSLQQTLVNETFSPNAELGDVPDKMIIVATELATNALRHSLPPTIVRLGRAEVVFVLDVADHDPLVIPEFAEARPPGAGGLGLQLARKLALDIGWYVEGKTKHVWAQFEAPAA
ncbi:ATP-binding protein [Mangrovihabitans endophyticus]|uniref:Anti-sigma regulatory factor (Ser/Thr protein kinase) n=1 Tax=Mangrovihabitans endophyticus TaxID=1751298 RepID=A0A8J3C1B3_9ACTN|nr:ATP-binding protein [Mangrovihabitans endophyticus]GGK95488.1 hypothetical protein GCM10012284_31980 [Mangrovihabitans endophyticus]